MGWIQFIQIAKEASWHDSSLYLIHTLALSVTSYVAKWWFLHLLLVTKRTSQLTEHTASVHSDYDIKVRQLYVGNGGRLLPLVLIAAVAPVQGCHSLSEVVWQSWEANHSLDVSAASILAWECVSVWVFRFLSLQPRGALTGLTRRRDTRRDYQRTFELTFEEAAVGERATDLRIFAGHKVTHSVSTLSASQSNSSQAPDHWGGRGEANMFPLSRLLCFRHKNTAMKINLDVLSGCNLAIRMRGICRRSPIC